MGHQGCILLQEACILYTVHSLNVFSVVSAVYMNTPSIALINRVRDKNLRAGDWPREVSPRSISKEDETGRISSFDSCSQLVWPLDVQHIAQSPDRRRSNREARKRSTRVLDGDPAVAQTPIGQCHSDDERETNVAERKALLLALHKLEDHGKVNSTCDHKSRSALRYHHRGC